MNDCEGNLLKIGDEVIVHNTTMAIYRGMVDGEYQYENTAGVVRGTVIKFTPKNIRVLRSSSEITLHAPNNVIKTKVISTDIDALKSIIETFCDHVFIENSGVRSNIKLFALKALRHIGWSNEDLKLLAKGELFITEINLDSEGNVTNED